MNLGGVKTCKCYFQLQTVVCVPGVNGNSHNIHITVVADMMVFDFQAVCRIVTQANTGIQRVDVVPALPAMAASSQAVSPYLVLPGSIVQRVPFMYTKTHVHQGCIVLLVRSYAARLHLSFKAEVLYVFQAFFITKYYHLYMEKEIFSKIIDFMLTSG